MGKKQYLLSRTNSQSGVFNFHLKFAPIAFYYLHTFMSHNTVIRFYIFS